jgi:CheY-like chemotaxis protein
MDSSLPWQGGSTVVVDDNMTAASMLADFLRLIGHDSEVLPVTSVQDITAAILRRAPDIAFLDISLAGLDGCEIAGLLRAHGCTSHLIAITGLGEPDDFARSRRAGFDEHWTKPLDVERIERFMTARPRRELR